MRTQSANIMTTLAAKICKSPIHRKICWMCALLAICKQAVKWFLWKLFGKWMETELFLFQNVFVSAGHPSEPQGLLFSLSSWDLRQSMPRPGYNHEHMKWQPSLYCPKIKGYPRATLITHHQKTFYRNESWRSCLANSTTISKRYSL